MEASVLKLALLVEWCTEYFTVPTVSFSFASKKTYRGCRTNSSDQPSFLNMTLSPAVNFQLKDGENEGQAGTCDRGPNISAALPVLVPAK